jgi:hypothetical protein
MIQFSSSNPRSIGTAISTLAILIATSAGSCRTEAANLYYSREFLEDPSCIYSTNEAFVLIGKTTTVEAVGASDIVLGLLAQDSGNRERVAQDLIVCHLTNRQARTYYLSQFGHAGSPFFFKGSLYFGRGGRAGDWPLLWRWMGTNFARVAKDEAVSIYGQFRYTSDLMVAEGWNEIPCVSFGSYSGTGDKRPFELPTARLWLVAKQEGGFSGKHSVSIQGLGGDGRELPIIILDQGLKRINKATFEKLRKEKAPVPGA